MPREGGHSRLAAGSELEEALMAGSAGELYTVRGPRASMSVFDRLCGSDDVCPSLTHLADEKRPAELPSLVHHPLLSRDVFEADLRMAGQPVGKGDRADPLARLAVQSLVATCA